MTPKVRHSEKIFFENFHFTPGRKLINLREKQGFVFLTFFKILWSKMTTSRKSSINFFVDDPKTSQDKIISFYLTNFKQDNVIAKLILTTN